MFFLSCLSLLTSKEALSSIPDGDICINTINAYSYNLAQKNRLYADALANSDYLLPDGASIVMACRWLKGKSQPKERVAGWDLFSFEMERLEKRSEKKVKNGEKRLRVMFVGSSEQVLALIKKRAAKDYPNLEVLTYLPPYKDEFTEEESQAIVDAVNAAQPDLLWIGMTAPKQELWVWQHWKQLNINCHVGTIGAVFDFYAGTAKRAPLWMQRHAMEWLYRLVKEPRRLWRRYLIGNPLFVWHIIKEKRSKANDTRHTFKETIE